MHWIPDIPSTVKEKIDAENLIIQRTLWMSSSEKRNSSQQNFSNS